MSMVVTNRKGERWCANVILENGNEDFSFLCSGKVVTWPVADLLSIEMYTYEKQEGEDIAKPITRTFAIR